MSPRRRARFTLPLLALVGAALVGGRFLKSSYDPDEATILGIAKDRGILPLEPHPGKGTAVYQWDPELRDIAPFFIGAVTDPIFQSHGHAYTVVKRPHFPSLYIDIKPGDNRYWVKATPP